MSALPDRAHCLNILVFCLLFCLIEHTVGNSKRQGPIDFKEQILGLTKSYCLEKSKWPIPKGLFFPHNV